MTNIIQDHKEDNYLLVALKLAQEAAHLVISLRGTISPSTNKPDSSPVTEADLQADKMIREGLLKAFPDHGILTEEGGFMGEERSPWTWLVDPLDGTKAYAKGIPGFSVMIGLLKSEAQSREPYLGVVVDPLQGFTYQAVKGHGAYVTCRGKRSRLQVSNRHGYAEMPLVTSTDFPNEKLEKINKKLHLPLCTPINSVGIKVGLLVRQVADIYVNHHFVHYWDICAPQIILEEAGGCFTQIDGARLNYNFSDDYSYPSLTLATNGTRHGELVKVFGDLI